MFKNVFYDKRTSNIHLWDAVGYTRDHWVPFVFLKSNSEEIFSIDGNSVERKTFPNYRAYYDYNKDNMPYENNVVPEIQYLTEKYCDIEDVILDSPPKLKIYSLDIEVHSEKEFPDPKEANHPVVLISIKDFLSKKTITFGTKEYSGNINDIKYYHIPSEKKLLLTFFNFINKYPPDVITGWNVMEFDLQYLINRSKVLFGETKQNPYLKISPIGIVNTWKTKNDFYQEVLNIDIAGISVIDYLDVYKRFSPNKLESYKLDFVSNFELEEGKLDYSKHKNLKTVYHNDWNLYVDYNVNDVVLIDKLEEKLGYINLVQMLSLLTCTPMKYYKAQTQLIEGKILLYLRNNNLCAPIHDYNSKIDFPAAYVKIPNPGLYKWVVDLDITSSYPSHIITLNMSPETYYGRIHDLSEDEIVNYMELGTFPEFTLNNKTLNKIRGQKLNIFNRIIKQKKLTVSPCGSLFSTEKIGIFPILERSLFDKRKEVKTKKIECKKLISEKTNKKLISELEVKAKKYDSAQLAVKVILNAVFGITAVPYSRFFNPNISEAITSCGRSTIKAGEIFVNEILNKPNKKLVSVLNKIDKYIKNDDKFDYVIYGDTDSVYIDINSFITNNINDNDSWDSLNDNEKIDYILSICKVINEYVNNNVYDKIQNIRYNSTIKDFRIEFKQEIIAKTALFLKKKKYAYWCVNEEGAPVDELGVKGLEIVQSTSSKIFRDMLKEIMNMLLKDSTDKEIKHKIIKFKDELKKIYPEEIASTKNVNGIDKYINENLECKKGTPWHVKGVANYKKLLKLMKLEDKYEDIDNGTKIRIVYLKPNKFGFDEISFIEWPEEFNNIISIDYDKMIEKAFISKIEAWFKPIGKDSLLRDNLNEEKFNLFFEV